MILIENEIHKCRTMDLMMERWEFLFMYEDAVKVADCD